MSDDVTTVTIEAGDNPKPNDTTKTAKPEGIPDKFWDAEKGSVRVDDLAKSYAELEKKQSKPPETPKDPPKEPAGKLDAGDNLAITPDQQKKLDAAGVDLAALHKEYAEKGQLSEETYKKLEASKLPKALVDGYIEGQKALAAKTQADVFEAVGGKDAYAKAIEWAQANLPEEEILAYDNSLKGKSLAELKVAAKGLIARAQAAPKDPELILGGETPDGIKPYGSMNELVADQRKPEYKTNPAFREKVKARLAISKTVE